MLRIFLLIIACMFMIMSSCTSKQSENEIKEKPALSAQDSMATADADAVMGLVRQKVDGSSIDRIGLNTKVTDIKTIHKIKPKKIGSKRPTIAYGRISNKRMTWGLTLQFEKPFGIDPNDTPHQVSLEISLSEQALTVKDSLVQHIAEYLGAVPDTWKDCQGYWLLVTADMNTIYIIVADSKPEEKQEEADDNVIDFS
jgi:hypothetical protein